MSIDILPTPVLDLIFKYSVNMPEYITFKSLTREWDDVYRKYKSVECLRTLKFSDIKHFCLSHDGIMCEIGRKQSVMIYENYNPELCKMIMNFMESHYVG